MLHSSPAINRKDVQSKMNCCWPFKRVVFSGLFWGSSKFVVAFRTFVCYCNSASVYWCSCRQKGISPREMQHAETISYFWQFHSACRKNAFLRGNVPFPFQRSVIPMPCRKETNHQQKREEWYVRNGIGIICDQRSKADGSGIHATGICGVRSAA